VSAADDPPEPVPDPAKLTGTALLQQVKRKLAAQRAGNAKRGANLFRVVEVTLDTRGRLSSQGQIWHSDLDHVRRFGHALGANSTSQRVVIADRSGAVVEKIPVGSAPGAAPGWEGWRERPLPPLPPRQKPSRPPLAVRAPAPGFPPGMAPDLPPAPPPAASPAPAPADVGQTPVAAPSRPPRDIPVVEQEEFDPEATATLTPAPPP
jgi:hypothetical protein